MVIPDINEGTSDADYTEMEFSTPVESDNAVLFDISSALRAVADRYEYKNTPPSQYPYVKFRLEAFDDWMIDGVLYEHQGEVLSPGSAALPVPSTNLFTGIGNAAGWKNWDQQQGDVSNVTIASGWFQQASAYIKSNAMSLEPNMTYKVIIDTDGAVNATMRILRNGVLSESYQLTYDELEIPEQSQHVSFTTDDGDWSNVYLLFSTANSKIQPVSVIAQQRTKNVFLYAYCILGRFTDIERLLTVGNTRTIGHFTRKPTTMVEQVICGTQYVRPVDPETPMNITTDTVSDTNNDTIPDTIISGAPVGFPKSQAYNVPTTAGPCTLGGANLYAILSAPDLFVLRFINLLGCEETLHIRSMRKVEVKMNTDQYVISRQETFTKFSRGLAVKDGNYEEWKMTSGPVDESWAAWFMHEFLLVQSAWLQIGSSWVPCHIIPEDTQVLADRQKKARYEVQFTLKLDIEGSPSLVLNS